MTPEELRAKGLPIWRIALKLNLTVWQVNHTLGGSYEAKRQRKAAEKRQREQAERDAVEREMEAMRWL